MVFCRNCGSQLKEGVKFCTECGERIPEQDLRSQQRRPFENVQQAAPVYSEPIEEDYDDTPVTPKKIKKKHIIIIVIAAVIGIALITAVVVVGIQSLSQETKPNVEYDGGFIDVTGVKEGNNWVFTPVMREGYVFDYWVLPNGDRSTDKTLVMTSGGGTIKGYSTPGFTVTVYSMYGITVTGGGEYKIREGAAVLKAADDTDHFIGWYSSGSTCLSTEKEYTITGITDVTVVAKSTSTKETGSSLLEADLSGSGIVPATSNWYVLDGGLLAGTYSGVSSISASLNPGVYTVIVNGKDSSGTDRTMTKQMEITGEYELYYSWTYKDVDYSTSWKVSYEKYKESKNSTVSRSPTTEGEMRTYATTALPDYDVINYLRAQSSSMSEVDRANFVLKFVQVCTWYQTDTDYNGTEDYWKFPLETMVDQRGDCEDTSILYCNIMRELGHDTALLLYIGAQYSPGHAAAGVNVNATLSGTYYEVDGVVYYYCETTSKTMVVGEPWTKYTDPPDNCTKVTVPGKK